MPESSYNIKRVAKNTVILYVRMFFMMLISLYTTRVILNTLGVEDYGVYNVVGGFVGMFGILTSSLSTAISRFITFGLGKRDLEALQKIYSTAIIIQISMAIIVGLLIEGIGFWYLYNKMNIPAERIPAAFWVLQCSIVTFGLGLLCVPYNAEIVAHEKMDVFAYFSILDAAIALSNVFILKAAPFDKLILYAVLCMCTSLLMRILYAVYCRKHFEECRFRVAFEKGLLKEMGSFAGWNFLGQGAWILNTTGVNLLVNYFFGVTFNAARGIADQVNGAISKLAGNFTAAMNPQITKTYAEGNLEAMHSLIFRGTRLANYLMILLAIPICLEAPTVLRLWLGNVPEHAVLFTRLVIIGSVINSSGGPLVTAQLATGNIKRYQIIITLFGLWVFPLSWIAFKMGLPAQWSYYFFIAVYSVLIFVRIYLVKDLIQLPWIKYCVAVLGRIVAVATTASVISAIAHFTLEESVIRVIIVTFVSTLTLGTCVLLFGVEKQERAALIAYAENIKAKILRKNV